MRTKIVGDSMQNDTISTLKMYLSCASIVLLLTAGVYPLKGLSQNLAQNHYNAENYVPLSWFAQESEQSVYKEKIDLSIRKASFGEAIQRIAKLGKIRLSYDKNQLPEGEITLVMRNVSVVEAFMELLVGTSMEALASPRGQVIIKRKSVPIKEVVFQETVIGTVLDANSGETLPGVNIVVKGTSTGTSTNLDGEYELAVPSLQDTLVVSYVGYQSQEVPVGGRMEIDIALQPQAIVGEELVVIGYGTQTSEELTGSISSIESEDFVEGAVGDAAQLIQGKLAGVNVVTPDGNPLSTSEISLRGVTTLMGSTDPLVLIDGTPGSLNDVSPQEIESIDVLKDGSAAAIYGTRGSNGVILITTEGVTGDISPQLEINSYISTQTLTKKTDVFSSSEYRQLAEQSIPGVTDQGATTNWVDVISQTPVTQSHDISLKGGNQSSNYILSLRYSDEQGILRQSNNQLLQPRLKLHHEVFDGKLNFSGNFSGFLQKFNPDDFIDAYTQAVTYNPTAPVYTQDGSYYQNLGKLSGYTNPVSILEEDIGERKANKLRLQGSVFADPIENLSIMLRASKVIDNNVLGRYLTKEHNSTIRGGLNGVATRATARTEEDILEITSEYQFTLLEQHKFTALGGYSWNNETFENYSMENNDFQVDDLLYNSIGNGQALPQGRAGMSSYKQETKLIGWFGRINYNFDNRYLLMASLRREGSSKFGVDNKWGNFPSASIGWNIHNESFMSDIKHLSQLRIRGGYGVTGNIPTDPFLSLAQLNFDASFLDNGQWIPAIQTSTNPNPDLQWETKTEINIGLNFGFFNDRISGKIDLYNRKTAKMLWNYPVSSPPFLHDNVTANAASMENRGIEIKMSAIPVQTSDFQWSTSANYSTNRNKITSLADDRFSIAAGFFNTGNTIGVGGDALSHRVAIGEPVGNFYGYKAIDVSEDGFWILEGEDGEPIPSGQRQPDDKQIIGNGLPNHYLNFNNTLTFKNFDVNIQMRGAFGFQIFNETRNYLGTPVAFGRGNALDTALDPVFGKRPINQNQPIMYNNYFIEDGDYWKISNIIMGYTFSSTTSTFSFLNNVRIYLSADNVWTITGYDGIDPEVSIKGLDPGFDSRGRYPKTRTFTLGINLQLQ